MTAMQARPIQYNSRRHSTPHVSSQKRLPADIVLLGLDTGVVFYEGVVIVGDCSTATGVGMVRRIGRLVPGR